MFLCRFTVSCPLFKRDRPCNHDRTCLPCTRSLRKCCFRKLSATRNERGTKKFWLADLDFRVQNFGIDSTELGIFAQFNGQLGSLSPLIGMCHTQSRVDVLLKKTWWTAPGPRGLPSRRSSASLQFQLGRVLLNFILLLATWDSECRLRASLAVQQRKDQLQRTTERTQRQDLGIRASGRLGMTSCWQGSAMKTSYC